MGIQINIAATKEDWTLLFRESGGDELIRFYCSSTYSTEEITPLRIDDVPGLGCSKTGRLLHDDSFLAIPSNVQIVPREIHLNRGGIRYAIDQLTNPDSIFLSPGGFWQSNCYVIGEISSLYNTGVTIDVAKKIRRLVKKRFHPIDYYWIGPECYRLYSGYTFNTDCRNC